MRNLTVLAMILFVVPASAQQLDLSSLDALREKASESVVVDLDPALMRFATAFLSEQDLEEAAALQIAEKLEAIQVRVFEFSEDGAYSSADLEGIHRELDMPGWSAIVQVTDKDDNENVGVWIHLDDNAVNGFAVLVEEPDELVVVNIVGSINPEDIAALGGQFGFPTGGDGFDLEAILEFGGALSQGGGADSDDDNDTDDDDHDSDDDSDDDDDDDD